MASAGAGTCRCATCAELELATRLLWELEQCYFQPSMPSLKTRVRCQGHELLQQLRMGAKLPPHLAERPAQPSYAAPSVPQPR